jgi:hypothetical protein
MTPNFLHSYFCGGGGKKEKEELKKKTKKTLTLYLGLYSIFV